MKDLVNNSELNIIFNGIKGLINISRNKVYQTVNTEMLNLYWNIGKIIIEMQNGEKRASYWRRIIKKAIYKIN